MRLEVHYNHELNRRRWVAYFDLLGSRTLISTKKPLEVFLVYTQAIEEAKKRVNDFSNNINIIWFSDSYIFYSEGDSGDDFTSIESICRWFMYFLLTSGVPVRGSLSCDELYVDKDNSLYFGPALVESNKYGEGQDWIGFILCPSTVRQMEIFGLKSNERLNYVFDGVPFKIGFNGDQKCVLACILGNWIQINNKNICLEKLMEMKSIVSDSNIYGKYDRTINFIVTNQRRFNSGV